MNQADLFDAWERALPLGPTGRALALASAATDRSDDVAALPVGVRDGRLLDLYVELFGARLEALVNCPVCGADLELAVAADQLRAASPATDPVLRVGGYRIRVRPPDSRDLAAVAGLEPADARAALLRRCVSVAEGRVDDLPEPVVDAVEQAMLDADPLSEIRIRLTCEPCGHRWHAELDVTAFVWAQLDAWARRCAVEVHILARAYGWREADILAMSPYRRSLYLQLVAS
jgi:hypothetical protein